MRGDKARGDDEMITEVKLKELGFEERNLEDETFLYLKLRKNKDRHQHCLRWYADEPETFYIDCDYMSGLETISEEEFLLNHNNLTDSAVQHYKEIMEKLK